MPVQNSLVTIIIVIILVILIVVLLKVFVGILYIAPYAYAQTQLSEPGGPIDYGPVGGLPVPVQGEGGVPITQIGQYGTPNLVGGPAGLTPYGPGWDLLLYQQ